MNVDRAETVKVAREEYNSYDGKKCRHDYFDEITGGYLVPSRQRIEHAKISKNEKAKFDKEFEQALVFAKNGFRMELLKEGSRISLPDARCNNILADLKRTSSHNNIVNYAKKAIHEQHAEMVLFQFDKETDAIYKQLEVVKNKGIKAYYFFSGKENKIYQL
ncbi:MAG: hypothetical protein LBR08_00765 [Bacteroidales bacterium]|nr:hypothetical protein [Bacteroidales bacterium]